MASPVRNLPFRKESSCPAGRARRPRLPPGPAPPHPLDHAEARARSRPPGRLGLPGARPGAHGGPGRGTRRGRPRLARRPARARRPSTHGPPSGSGRRLRRATRGMARLWPDRFRPALVAARRDHPRERPKPGAMSRPPTSRPARSPGCAGTARCGISPRFPSRSRWVSRTWAARSPRRAGGFLSGTLDRHVRGYDVATGEEIWRHCLPAGGQGTSMTYTGEDGRQYLLVVAGGHGSLGTKAGDHVMAFALPRS